MSEGNIDELRAQLAERAAQVEARVGYALVPFDDGEAIRVASAVPLPTASCIKVYILAALYAADAAGRLSLDERVEYTPEHQTLGSGVLKLLEPGCRLTLRDHARLMIVISDNAATNTCIRTLGGPAKTQEAIQALPISLPGTHLKDFINFDSMAQDAFAVSSADDFTALLTSIFRKTCTGSAAHDEEVYWTLRRQQLRSMLPRYLPCSEYAEEFGVEETYRCGTKSGSLPGVRADVGIVETPVRSWAMAVQVQGDPDFNTGSEHPFTHVIADMSQLVFDAWGRA